MIDAKTFGSEIHARLDGMDEPAQFRFLAMLYDGLPYVGGRESPVTGADCSGTVCGPLYLMGYDIRTTADDLMRAFFTIPAEDNPLDMSWIMAIFYRTKTRRSHFGRMVEPGTATHVTPVVGRFLVINAFQQTIRLDTSARVYEYYHEKGYEITWRALDMGRLRMAHQRRSHCYGIDSDLERLRE